MTRAVLTPEEVAERWGCSARHVQRLIEGGHVRTETSVLGGVMIDVAESELALRERSPTHDVQIVYVVRCGDYVKIGTTENMKRRLRGMLSGNPYPIEVLAERLVSSRVERHLQARFKPHRHRLEWFRIEGAVADWIAEGCPYE